MKELFLVRQRTGPIDDYFEFRPYKYGPHADEVLSDLEKLVHDGYVQTSPGMESEIYSLTPAGVDRAASLFFSLDERLRRKLVDIKIQFNGMPLPELLDHVYERYPRFAVLSEYEGPPVE